MATNMQTLGKLAQASPRVKQTLDNLQNAERALDGFVTRVSSQSKPENLQALEAKLRRTQQNCGREAVAALMNASDSIGRKDALGMLNDRYTISD